MRDYHYSLKTKWPRDERKTRISASTSGVGFLPESVRRGGDGYDAQELAAEKKMKSTKSNERSEVNEHVTWSTGRVALVDWPRERVVRRIRIRGGCGYKWTGREILPSCCGAEVRLKDSRSVCMMASPRTGLFVLLYAEEVDFSQNSQSIFINNDGSLSGSFFCISTQPGQAMRLFVGSAGPTRNEPTLPCCRVKSVNPCVSEVVIIIFMLCLLDNYARGPPLCYISNKKR